MDGPRTPTGTIEERVAQLERRLRLTRIIGALLALALGNRVWISAPLETKGYRFTIEDRAGDVVATLTDGSGSGGELMLSDGEGNRMYLRAGSLQFTGPESRCPDDPSATCQGPQLFLAPLNLSMMGVPGESPGAHPPSVSLQISDQTPYFLMVDGERGLISEIPPQDPGGGAVSVTVEPPGEG